jgi:hypothetical protein
MLQLAPDAKTERETATEDADDLYCAACGALITKTSWRVSRNGEHEHVVFNPAGIVFRIVCFKEAPGVGGHGAASDEFTWFKGYRWTLVGCRGCNAHLGWKFSSGEDVFFALIKPKLSDKKPGSA